ncbi:MAG: hypothetical protein AAGI12_03210 [Pseudomonadota bacterium]
MTQNEQTSLFPLAGIQDDAVWQKRKRYLYFTKTVLPEVARKRGQHWPVNEDHCFQRIVLDHVCKGVWYHDIKPPAYKHMTVQQLDAAIALCEEIAKNEIDLAMLNMQSLTWRGKR